MRLSTVLKNARADAMETLIGPAPTLELRSGPPPADISSAASGALLVSMALPADWLVAATGGVKTQNGVWSAPAAAAGFVGHYRLLAGATCHLDGPVSQTWAASGGPTGTGAGVVDGGVTWDYLGAPDMTMDNTSVAIGQSTGATFSWTELG